MAELTTRTVSLKIDGFFKKPVLFKDAHCDETAQKSLDSFSGYGLKPSQILIRSGDGGFNYDIAFSLFNGNATLKILPEKLELYFQGIANDRDLEIVADCVDKFYQQVLVSEVGATTIDINAHATAVSAEVRDEYLSRFADASNEIIRTGSLVYVRCKNWPEEIRLLIDRSLVFLNDGIFFFWSTSFAGDKFTRQLMANLQNACEEAANKLGLSFTKPSA